MTKIFVSFSLIPLIGFSYQVEVSVKEQNGNVISKKVISTEKLSSSPGKGTRITTRVTNGSSGNTTPILKQNLKAPLDQSKGESIATLPTPEPATKFKNWAELSTGGSFKSEDNYTPRSSLEYEGRLSHRSGVYGSIYTALSRNYRDQTQLRFSDTSLKFGMAPLYKIKDSQTSFELSTALILPTSDSSRDQSLRAGGIVEGRIIQPIGSTVRFRYIPSFRLNSHQFDTSESKRSANIETISRHRGQLILNPIEPWSIRLETAFSRAADYEGFTSDKLTYEAWTEIMVSKVVGLTGKVTTDNNLQVGGEETQVVIFNRDVSVFQLGLSFYF